MDRIAAPYRISGVVFLSERKHVLALDIKVFLYARFFFESVVTPEIPNEPVFLPLASEAFRFSYMRPSQNDLSSK